MNRIYICLILLVATATNALSQDSPYPCEAPPRILEQIRRATPGTVESLLSQYPENFWIQQFYIDSHTGFFNPSGQNLGMPASRVDASVVARFKAGYDANPDDSRAAYLFAYALIHTDTPKAVGILTEIAKKTPPLPAALLTLAVLHSYPEFRDQEKLKSYTQSFLAGCPNTLEPRIASLALQLDRSDILTAYMRALRERIAGKADETLMPLYSYLWQLEMKHALPGEKKECEGRIRKDLASLEGLDQNKFSQAQSLIIQGYTQIGDKAALDKLMGSGAPLSPSAVLPMFFNARTEWARGNPMPNPLAGSEDQIKYYKKQLEFLDPWVTRIPDNMMVLEPRFQALASIPSTSNEILLYEGTKILELARRFPAANYASAVLHVLKAWAERDILLDTIPSIIQELTSGRFKTLLPSANTIRSDMAGYGSTSPMEENQRWTAETESWSILVAVDAKKGEFDQAKNTLTAWTKALDERRIRADEIRARLIRQIQETRTSNSPARQLDISEVMERSIVMGIPGDESKYYEACARLAAAEGRALDALTFYQSSLRMIFRGPASSADFRGIENIKTAGNAAWKQLGRTQEDWDAWIQAVQPQMPTQLQSSPRQAMATRQVPEFSLSDQHGVTWTLAGLKTKTTLINVWATWCGPCRRELPQVQKLYEQIKDRRDIQVITLNIDEDKSLVEPFLKDNNFSFPSLYANSFVREFAGPIGIPTTWLSDATGTIRAETVGYRDEGDQWVVQTLKQMENIGGNAR